MICPIRETQGNPELNSFQSLRYWQLPMSSTTALTSTTVGLGLVYREGGRMALLYAISSAGVMVSSPILNQGCRILRTRLPTFSSYCTRR